MPVSPFQRAAQEQAEAQPGGGSAAGGGKRKRASKPTSKARRKRQKTKDRYAHAREDAQLEGLIPTTPEEALKPERVPPSAQGEQAMPDLIARAIRSGWKVPEGLKPELVDEMVRVIMDPYAKPKDKIGAFRALQQADRSQWEQENPAEAGKANGAAQPIAVSLQSNVLAVKMIKEALERDVGGGESLLPASSESCAPGGRRFDGQVETCAASTTDQPGTGQSMAHPEQSDVSYGPLPAREADSE